MRERLEAVIKALAYWGGLQLLFLACTYNSIDLRVSDCNDGSLLIQAARSEAPNNCSIATGVIEVSASGGTPPYKFALAGKEPQSSSIFAGLSSGEYRILVFDARNCSDTLIHYLPGFESNLSAQARVNADSGCISNTNTGMIQVTVLNGRPPYQFQLNNQSFSGDSIFDNLKFGNYSINIKDIMQCQFSLNIIVPRTNSGLSWQHDVRPIINVSCVKSGCHDDKSGRTSLMNFENIKSNANQIRSRVINRSMPFDAILPEEQIRIIVCWIDDGAPKN